jgi:dCTP deaminase
MILSDGEIRQYLKRGLLCVNPIDEVQIQPASIDITLGNTFAMLKNIDGGVLDPEDSAQYDTFIGNKYLLSPGHFVLATTRESIALPNDLTAFVEGRSSWGRLGLFIQNAGWVDPGFKGEITLELFNANRYPIELTTGVRIGQLVFAKMSVETENPYNGKYQGQHKATGSKIHLDFI